MVLRMKAVYWYRAGALAALLAGATLMGLSYFQGPEAAYAEAGTIAEGAADFEALAVRFEALSTEKGGAYAFEVLRRAQIPPNTDLHLLGHRVGDILYQQKGIEGIQDCTQDFRNACSHSIVVGALTDFGEAALPEIREACKKAPGGPGAYTMCYHGLGHGVFAFFSYSLPETVAMCEKTGTPEYRNREAIECIGGAIMELTGGGGHDREAWEKAREKYLLKNDPLSPCMSAVIPDESKSQCLTYLTPELWKHADIDMGTPNPEQFADAFTYCEKIPTSKADLRDACFGGFGKEFVPLSAGRDIRRIDELDNAAYERAIEWCMSARPQDGKRSCLDQALNSIFWGGENNPQASFRFCSLVTDAALQPICYAQLGGNIRQYTSGEKRSSLCAQLPESAQEVCAPEAR